MWCSCPCPHATVVSGPPTIQYGSRLVPYITYCRLVPYITYCRLVPYITYWAPYHTVWK